MSPKPIKIISTKNEKAKPAKKAPVPTKKGGFQIDLMPKLVALPDIEKVDKTKLNVRYPLLPPYAYAHLFWNSKNKELVYFVQEPLLNDTEKELLRLVQLGLEEMINISFIKAVKSASVMEYLERNVQSILLELGTKVSKDTYNKIMYYIYRNSVGLNQIESLLRDFYIEVIECNGTGFPIYVVHIKYGNLKTNVMIKTKEGLTDFVEKLAQKCGKYVSYANPLLDGSLPDGSRVNATYTEDITTRGPTFTIRKFTKEPWTPINLLAYNTASSEAFAYLWIAIENKMNIMTIGETASGKTTFLNTIAHFIPPESRIVSIEDTREVALAHINWLPSVTRVGFGMPAAGQKIGEITLFDLLKETFRQNPDYVILGETRGEETYVLFQGMASGHPSLATFHAGSVDTFVRRLETPPINLPASLVEGLDIICVTTHVKTPKLNIRRVREIDEVIEVKEKIGAVKSNVLFEWNAIKDKFDAFGKSHVLQSISDRTGISMKELTKELKRRAELLEKMHKKGILGLKEFSAVINEYYKDPAAVRKRFGIK
ncbi:hypothetical protein DRJ17_06560 [Candidatus Woesearchaeota archaeon]|nr:MAG: hypothetical protein DRJ17_06560 [Candidatus Woesearchaeota archaeon]